MYVLILLNYAIVFILLLRIFISLSVFFSRESLHEFTKPMRIYT